MLAFCTLIFCILELNCLVITKTTLSLLIAVYLNFLLLIFLFIFSILLFGNDIVVMPGKMQINHLYLDTSPCIVHVFIPPLFSCITMFLLPIKQLYIVLGILFNNPYMLYLLFICL